MPSNHKSKSRRSKSHSSSSKSSSHGKSKSKSNGKSQSRGETGKGHPQIQDEFPRIGSHRYNDKDLARALCQNARRETSEIFSREDLKFIRRPIKAARIQRGVLRLLNAWFHVIDRAYFFSGLGGQRSSYTTIKVFSDGPLDDGNYAPVLRTINVNLYQSGNPDGDNPGAYIDTLIHEMLHGFLSIYSCECRRCRRNKKSRRGGAGCSGHGATWANPMSVIQESLAREVSWDVNFDVETGVILEMKTMRWQSREEQFERWGMAYRDVDELSELAEEDRPRMVLCTVM